MPQYIPLKLPPGVARLGTQYQSRGRWFDTHLVRWYQGVLQPVGGWEQLTGEAAVQRNDDFPSEEVLTVLGQTSEADLLNEPSFDDKYTVHFDVSVTNNATAGEASVVVSVEAFDGANWASFFTKRYTQSGPGSATFAHEAITTENANATKFRLNITDFDVPVVQASDNFSASNNLTAVGHTAEATTASAPSNDDRYQVHFSASVTHPGIGGTRTLHVAIETFDGAVWNTKSVSVFTKSTAGTDVYPHQIVTFTQVGQSATEKVRLRITADTTFTQFSVHGFDGSGDPSPGVTYVVEGNAEFAVHGFNLATDADPFAGVTYITKTGAVTTLTGICRGAFASERDVSRAAYLIMGTQSKIYHFESSVLTDVTPAAGFTAGQVDTTYAEGTSRLHGTATEATTWSFAEFVTAAGVITPLACSNSDGKIWKQDFPAGNPGTMTEITPSAGTVPEGVRFIFVTPERFLVAVGETNAPRQIAWCAQDDFTDWDFASVVEGTGAGANNLKGNGIPMCAVVGDGEHLILTDQELYAMRYIGGQGVYGFSQRGANCGIISRRAFASINTGTIVWMGAKQFFLYDGYVRTIPCEVADYVFNDINIDQAAKVWAMTNTQFGEVWWFYPSKEGATSEIDRYVVWNHQTNHWYVGTLARLAGVDAGALQYPVLVAKSGSDSVIYEHEKGLDHEAEVPFAESGPVEIGEGDQLLAATQLLPDERTVGDVEVTLYSRLFPAGDETAHGPFSSVNPTPVRVSARQVRLRLQEAVERDWRVGTFRLEVHPDGRR